MLHDFTDDPMMRLLVDATRRADCAGPALARAHREVGRALGAAVASYLPLEEVEIEHVAGRSTGVRVRPGAEPIVVALMRGGLFVAEGLWERLPGAALLPYAGGTAAGLDLPAAGRTVVVVDSVINTGRSLGEALDRVQSLGAARALAVTLVGYRPSVLALVEKRPEVGFVAARLSERSYVGRGPTDTGGRLFGTTAWTQCR
jgi:uracil phosphoribosyltransferase